MTIGGFHPMADFWHMRQGLHKTDIILNYTDY